MKKWAYYNEFDLKAAEWLRELIKQCLIMDGEVDTRSICDVKPDDVRGFIRVGFFAGIGGWDYALRLAGWPEDEEIWHGSCPCQAFSTAGKQKGFDDHRDLWPVFFNLIKECRPKRLYGEQVENAIKHGWLDRVYADLEAENYAVGAAVLGAHSVGAPHMRQRLYWGAVRVSDTAGNGHDASNQRAGRTDGSSEQGRMLESAGSGDAVRLSNSNSERCNRKSISEERRTDMPETAGGSPALCISNSARGQCEQPIRIQGNMFQRSAVDLPDCRMAENADGGGCGGRSDGDSDGQGRKVQTPGLGACGGVPAVALGDGCGERLQGHAGNGDDRNEPGRHGTNAARSTTEAGGNDNLSSVPWSRYALVYCRDNKVRRVPAESVLQRVADGLPESMDISRAERGFPLCKSASFEKGQIAVLLKGYGNSINPYTAAEFIKAFNHKERK